jgi:diguanylate cyclase (GGDEF)-like protein
VFPKHKTFARQLREHTRPDGSIDLASLFIAVEATYQDNDQNLKRIDRANRLMAEELEDALAVRDAAAVERAARLEAMEAAQTAIAASEARSRHLAYHDTLTGLPNRALLQEKLAQAMQQMRRSGATFAVHCIDLDNFKSINDTFGHQAGDELVRAVSALLSETCGRDDTIARLGGDEFAIIQANASEQDAEDLAARLVEAISRPIDLELVRVHIGCSIGILVVNDGSVEPLETLRQADLALYQAKAEGRSRFVVFRDEMDKVVRTRRELQEDLRIAIAKGDIELVYQPQVNDGGKILGGEALARWVHPTRGPIPPSVFVPIAEEGGLIVDLGLFVLRRAFEDAARWPDLQVAVNASAAQLRMKTFIPQIRALLRETGAQPKQFELEITEGVLMGDDLATHDTLEKLRALGFSLALDDFGTGYSSLSYLRRFPIDKIKIDRSFIVNLGMDAEAESIVLAIVKLAHSLNMKVVAEGVETETQRDSVSAAGCNFIQGFLFGKPMVPNEIDKLCPRNDFSLSAVA